MISKWFRGQINLVSIKADDTREVKNSLQCICRIQSRNIHSFLSHSFHILIFKMSRFGIFALVLILHVVYASSARVTFCSGENLTGTCATKNVEVGFLRNKCEDFPFRFRWFFTARSVKVENAFFGGCPGVCRLHDSSSCRCWLGNCPTLDISCTITNLPDGHGLEGITCV